MGAEGQALGVVAPSLGLWGPSEDTQGPQSGIGMACPLPNQTLACKAAPSPPSWQGAARPPALGDESWSFRGAGEEPVPGSSPPAPPELLPASSAWDAAQLQSRLETECFHYFLPRKRKQRNEERGEILVILH